MISTKGRYALRVLIDVANQGKDVRVPLRDIASRQEISEKYLQQVAHLLVSAGLLVGASGRGGGYRLARPASDISVLEVIEAAESTIAPVACLAPNASPCERTAECVTLPVWRRYFALTREFFSGVTLADLTGAEPEAVSEMLERLEVSCEPGAVDPCL